MVVRIKTFNRKINLVETRRFKNIVSDFSQNPSQSVFFCNVHMLMLSQEDKALANAMDSADWIFADSAPVAWLQRRISGKDAKVIPGYKVMLAICDYAAKNNETVGFLGSTPDVMKNLVNSLCKRFKKLPVAYQYCPPFMPEEVLFTPQELEALKEAEIKWLFVGLGCPKQEKWIATYRSDLDCHVLGVGAAFDWLSGLVRKPPDWMERFALAWLYRLLNNPAKMWDRYLIYNTKFIIRTGRLLVRGK